MIFWVFVGLAVTLFALYIRDAYYDLSIMFLVVSVICMFVAGFMLIDILSSNIGVDGIKAQIQQRYESLTYQLNNNLYDNDNDIGKKELFTEIRNYNESMAYNKEVQDDFWVGIFYPNIYDEFELIDLD